MFSLTAIRIYLTNTSTLPQTIVAVHLLLRDSAFAVVHQRKPEVERVGERGEGAGCGDSNELSYHLYMYLISSSQGK